MKAFLNSVLGRFAVLAACLLVFSGSVPQTAMAESFSASSMRLLKYTGTVEIEDASGQPRFVLENSRFDSGEALKTGPDSNASVGLDDDRIVTLDEESRVEFTLEGKHMEMFLTEGSLMLDVQDKLDDDETLDIKTSTIAVGIRGTIVFLKVEDPKTAHSGFESVGLGSGQEAASGQTTVLGVLEGVAQLSFRDETGAAHVLDVRAGEKATIKDSNINDFADAQPAITELTRNDIRGFVEEQIAQNQTMENRIKAVNSVKTVTDYPAEDNWEWDEAVTLIAQSASKLYDGNPLTRPGDVLVYGLPEGFSIRVSATGSLTNAGSAANPIGDYTIFNASGEEVTSHFKNIQTVDGNLTVDPAPLTIWTGSAEKTYDGTPLKCDEAKTNFLPGQGNNEVPWRNSSFVVRGSGAAISTPAGAATSGMASSGLAASGSAASNSAAASSAASAGGSAQGIEKADTEILYGICGTVWVHGTNPLTEETREIELYAGEKMTVYLNNDENNEQSIEFKVEKISEEELPEDILRLYADNPELMKQACADANWNEETMAQLIAALPAAPEKEEPVVEHNGLQVGSSYAEALMRDCTNVRITIDTQITNYNGRVLGNEEAHYTGVQVDDSIRIIPNGSQTNVGQSPNTYEIDWGTAQPSNYIVEEDLGTLTVTPAPATVTTGSSSKSYDGKPLTNSEASISGLVTGETATVTATGSITEPGTAINSYTISWDTAASDNYTLTEKLGTLTVKDDQTKEKTEITLTAGSDTKTYDGTPLTSNTVTAEGLPDGFTFTAETTGSQTNAGTSANTVSSYAISNQDGEDVTAAFDVNTVDGKLTVSPADLTITTGSAEKAYDGKALKSAEVSITGLADADAGSVTVTATGSITNVGIADNTYTIDWGSVISANYSLTEELGTLEVTKNDTEIIITSNSASKVYDGTPISAAGATVEGLPDGFTYTVQTQGSQTDAGSSANTVSSYTILNQDGKDVTDNFTNVTLVKGTLTITPLKITFEVNAYDTVFNGYEQLPEGVTGTYEDGSEVELEEETPQYDEFEILVHQTFIFNLRGDGKLQLDCDGYTDVGDYTITPVENFLSGKAQNYDITYASNTMTISPLPVKLTLSDTTIVYDGNAHSCEPVSVTCDGMDTSFSAMSDNEWEIYGYTVMISERITVKIEGGGTDPGTYPITISYTYNNNDPENYTVEPTSATLTIEPVKLIIRLGNPTAFYDMHMHGGSISVTYGNGTNEGNSLNAVTAMSNVEGDASSTYTLSTGDTLTVKTSGMGPSPGSYTLPCTWAFSPDRSSLYDVQVTDNILTILMEDEPGEIVEAEEGQTPGGSDDPENADFSRQNESNGLNGPDETDPAGQNSQNAQNASDASADAASGETDPAGQNAQNASDASADAASGETDPADQNNQGGQDASADATPGETDPASQNSQGDQDSQGGQDTSIVSASAASGETGSSGQADQGAAQASTEAPKTSDNASAKTQEPAAPSAPAAETKKKENPAAAEPEKKQKQEAPPAADNKPESKVENKAENKAENKTENKVENKTENKNDNKADSKTEDKAKEPETEKTCDTNE